jgi:peptide/nickel transport system substrate-binding protein
MARTSAVRVAALLASVVLLGGVQVTYYEESLPSTLNPLFARTMVDRRAQELVFDRLYYRSAVTSELKSRLVESATVLEGGKAVKLVIKDGVLWHDGEAFGAEDVCFTVRALLDPGTPSLLGRQYQEVLASCVVGSKREATITFVKPFHNATERLGFPVLPEHVFAGQTAIAPDNEFSLRPIGTGAMRASKGRREVKFTAAPGVHHTPRIDGLQLAEGGDPLVQIKTLLNGGVQGVISVAPGLRNDVAASDDVALKSYDLRSWWFVALNTNKGALADVRVRQALDHSVDREELRRLTMGYDPEDIAQPCQFISGPFVPSSPYYNRSVPVRSRSDSVRAKALMAEAGGSLEAGSWVVNGTPLVLKIGMSAPLDLEAKDLLNQLGNQLQAGGFQRQVYKVSADDWVTKAQAGQLTDFDLLIGKWSFGVVEDVGHQFQTRTGGNGTLNLFDFSNPEVDRLLTTYDRAVTDTAAQDAYHDLHAVLARELPYLFLWKLDTKSAWRMEVKGNTITPYYYFTEFDGWTAIATQAEQ